jgi:hypothetical protein
MPMDDDSYETLSALVSYNPVFVYSVHIEEWQGLHANPAMCKKTSILGM